MKGTFARISHAFRRGRRFKDLVARHHPNRADAWCVWSFAILVSSDELTDGRVYKHELATIIDLDRMEVAIDTLCDVHLLERIDEHTVQICDYAEHNNTKAYVEEVLDRKRAAASKGGKASKGKRKSANSKRTAPAVHVLPPQSSFGVPKEEAEGKQPVSDSASVFASEIPDSGPPPALPQLSHLARVGSPTGPFPCDEPRLMVPEHHRKLVMPIVRECRSTFQKRYEQATGGGHWPGYGDTHELEKLAAWALQQGDMIKADPMDLAKGAIAGLFATRKREHWQMRYLLEDPTRYAEAALEHGHAVSA